MAKRADPQWFDDMYNNRALVPDFARHMAAWTVRSVQARQLPGAHLDIAYGLGEGETLDVFRSRAEPETTGKGKGNGNGSAGKAPVLVFLHGGYWRSLDKSDHSFVAPEFTQAGACVVVPNYALCPGYRRASGDGAAHRAADGQGLAWTWRNIDQYGGDPARITVAGHSAGGHLAAMMLACAWTGGGAGPARRPGAQCLVDLRPARTGIDSQYAVPAGRRCASRPRTPSRPARPGCQRPAQAACSTASAVATRAPNSCARTS